MSAKKREPATSSTLSSIKTFQHDYFSCNKKEAALLGKCDGYLCPFCGAHLLEEFIPEHINKHHSEPRNRENEATTFLEVFFKTEEIDSIEQIKTEKAHKCEGFVCPVCTEHFSFDDQFVGHLKEHHLRQRDDKKCSSTKLTLCKFNDVTDSLTSTAIILSPQNGNVSNVDLSQDEESVFSHRIDSKKRFKCSECSYTTTRKGDLKRHVLIHSCELPYSCQECDYKCKRKDYLVEHMFQHTGEKPFKCPECSFSTARKCDLKRHVRLHSGEVPYSCLECDYKCKQKQHLVAHMTKHTGEKPFKCPDCLYATALKSNLKIHARVHTGEVPYSCQQCDYKCKRKEHLKLHIMAKHTGKKPFKCTECSYATVMKSDLERHAKVHSGERPFKCDECSFVTADKSHLTRHTRLHLIGTLVPP